jgi:hypothetical protein
MHGMMSIKFTVMTLAPTCFCSHMNYPQGAVQYLAQNYKYGSTVLVGMDVVNVMAACEPVCLCVMCTDHGAGRYLQLPACTVSASVGKLTSF